MDEVCYVSNKYQPPNKLAEDQYFYTRNFVPPSFRKGIGAPHRKSFSKDALFATFSLFLRLSELVICVIYLINQLKNIFAQDT